MRRDRFRELEERQILLSLDFCGADPRRVHIHCCLPVLLLINPGFRGDADHSSSTLRILDESSMDNQRLSDNRSPSGEIRSLRHRKVSNLQRIRFGQRVAMNWWGEYRCA